MPRGELVARAKAWIKEKPRSVQPWDEKGFKPPGGKVYSAGGHGTSSRRPTRSIAARPTTIIRRRNILKASIEGLQVPIDSALRIEQRYFTEVLQTKEAAAMIRSLFVSMQELNKGARRPAADPADADQEGSACSAPASWAPASPSERAGRDRVVPDRPRRGERRQGQGDLAKLICDKRRRADACTEAAAEAALARIKPTTDYAALTALDLVIEAVFEDRAVKAEATEAPRRCSGKDTIFGSQHLDAADHVARRDLASGRRTSSASISSRRSSR